MSRNTRDTICATIGLVIVILLLTTVAALDEPVVPDTPPAVPPAVEDKLPGEGVPASGCAYLTAEPLGLFELTAYCPCSACCGKNDGITATGTVATEGRTRCGRSRTLFPTARPSRSFIPMAAAPSMSLRTAAAPSRPSVWMCSSRIIRPRASTASGRPMSFLSRKETAMNKDCKVSIERDANGSLKMQLTGHKDDIRMLCLCSAPALPKRPRPRFLCCARSVPPRARLLRI